MFAVGGHSAFCISIHRRYKVFGPARGHAPLWAGLGRIGLVLCTILHTYFRESLLGEVHRMDVPRTSVHGTNGVCVGSVQLLTFLLTFADCLLKKPEIHKLGSLRPSTGIRRI